MSQDASRQRKLAAKAARRKAVVAGKKRNAASDESATIAAAGRCPIAYCVMADGLFKGHIGTVILARTLPEGLLACGVFLVDPQCLGVTDAHFRTLSRHAFDQQLASLSQDQELLHVDPPTARKILHEAVAYAADLGLSPGPGYARAETLFGDVDASRSAATFTFGHNGKPLYVSGPFDTPARIRTVTETLDKRCGKGNWDFIIALPPSSGMEFDHPDEADL